MKIFILEVDELFQPNGCSAIYPSHNVDYGVEQDFVNFLYNNDNLITDDLSEADWYYLPVFWTRYFLNNNYAKTGLKKLQKECQNKIVNSNKTFTICQYDDGPIVDLKKTVQFLSSRMSNNGIDIPLLCEKHKKSLPNLGKKYLASFIGSFRTHPIRRELHELLKNDNRFYLKNTDDQIRTILHVWADIYIPKWKYLVDTIRSKQFVSLLINSKISLCPRGYGGSSFRFYESMQLGVVPFLIGDIDTRPFKKYIDWDSCSFYANSAQEASDMLKNINTSNLKSMGLQAEKIYNEKLSYGEWCKLVIKELEDK